LALRVVCRAGGCFLRGLRAHPGGGGGGGFLDTIVDGETGSFFDEPTPDAIAAAVRELVGRDWSVDVLTDHAARFAPQHFVDQVAAVVDEVRRST